MGRRVIRAEFIVSPLRVPGEICPQLWSIVTGGGGEDGLTASSRANEAS